MPKYTSAIGSRYPTRRRAQASVQQRCLVSAAILFGVLLFLDWAPYVMTVLSGVVGDKLFRFAAYASLSTLVYAGLSGSAAFRALSSLTLVGVMGGVEEAIQLLLPYHSANLLGWKFDMLVALTCVGMLMMLHPVFSEWFASQRLLPARRRVCQTPMQRVGRRRNVQ